MPQEKTQNLSLEALMRATQHGDQAAYHQFLSEAAEHIRRFLIKRMNRDDVEDVLQEVLTSIHKARHTYDGERPIMPWVYAIARFRLTDHLRKHYANQNDKQVPLDTVEYLLEAPVTESNELPEYLSVAVGELGEREQKIIHLMHVDDLTAKEVGSKLDMGESAVKVAAHRAYKKMRASIKR